MGHSNPLVITNYTRFTAMMKVFVLLALAAVAAAQQHQQHQQHQGNQGNHGAFRPGFNHGDPLHRLIHTEVKEILANNADIDADHCTTKCDALFDLNAGHDEPITDKICKMECTHQLHMGVMTTASTA